MSQILSATVSAAAEHVNAPAFALACQEQPATLAEECRNARQAIAARWTGDYRVCLEAAS